MQYLNVNTGAESEHKERKKYGFNEWKGDMKPFWTIEVSETTKFSALDIALYSYQLLLFVDDYQKSMLLTSSSISTLSVDWKLFSHLIEATLKVPSS
jgi:hypothetical protein